MTNLIIDTNTFINLAKSGANGGLGLDVLLRSNANIIVVREVWLELKDHSQRAASYKYPQEFIDRAVDAFEWINKQIRLYKNGNHLTVAPSPCV